MNKKIINNSYLLNTNDSRKTYKKLYTYENLQNTTFIHLEFEVLRPTLTAITF